MSDLSVYLTSLRFHSMSSGKKVLVLERGQERTTRSTPNAMDIFGAGKAVADESLTQLIQTNQGVRSQVAGVMGGGTSINMAIIAMESEEYFNYLNANYGWTLDLKLIDEVCRLPV